VRSKRTKWGKLRNAGVVGVQIPPSAQKRFLRDLFRKRLMQSHATQEAEDGPLVVLHQLGKGIFVSVRDSLQNRRDIHVQA
jgi:hypothetical protein